MLSIFVILIWNQLPTIEIQVEIHSLIRDARRVSNLSVSWWMMPLSDFELLLRGWVLLSIEISGVHLIMRMHHDGRASNSQTLNSKRRWLHSFLYFLQYFLLSFFELLVFLDNFPGFNLCCIDPTFESLSNHLLALIALRLLESKHVLQAAFVDAVITVSKHDTMRNLFNTHLAVGAFGLLLHLGLVPLTFLLRSNLLIAAGKEFGERHSVTLVLQRQKELIVLWLNFSSLQLTHYALVFIVVLVGIAITNAGLPVFIRGRSHHEVVLLMIFAFIAQFAYLYMLPQKVITFKILPHKICTVVQPQM